MLELGKGDMVEEIIGARSEMLELGEGDMVEELDQELARDVLLV